MSEDRVKIGILTSGGDAPGMNAAIRAVVRTAINKKIMVYGIRRGYEGLISADVFEMDGKSVSDTIHKGGTILKTARAPEMLTEEGQSRAANVCSVLGLSALIVIGGDGSFRGADELSKKGVNVICIPATIDLDLPCTDYTIGFDTAVNTGMEAINKIRDTSGSHERCSIVEVMGRNSGYIALWTSMTGGAEEVLIPENGEADIQKIVSQIILNRAKGKTHNLIVVAEGIGGGQRLAEEIEGMTGIETRATVLGYLQRGGSPTALDRMHASMMGYYAVEKFIENYRNIAIVFRKGEYISIDIGEALAVEKPDVSDLYRIIKTLSI